jgi:hypothetical protein
MAHDFLAEIGTILVASARLIRLADAGGCTFD